MLLLFMKTKKRAERLARKRAKRKEVEDIIHQVNWCWSFGLIILSVAAMFHPIPQKDKDDK